MKIRKKISLTFLGMLLISSLIMLPVITESKYFSILISRQLQHNADEMVAVYVDNFVKETGETFDALRSAVFFLSTDQGARSIMSSGTSATQIDILSVEQAFYRAFSTNGSINADVVNAIYLVQNEKNYFPIYGGHYGLNPSERILSVYRQYYKANTTRELYTIAGQDDYAYFITDYVDIDTVNSLGKIIVELNAPNLLNIASLQSLYPSATALFSDRSGAVIGAYGKEPPDHFDTTDEKTVTLEGKRWQHFYSDLQSDRERIDVFIPQEDILSSIRENTRIFFVIAFVILILALFSCFILTTIVLHPLRQMMQTIHSLADGDISARMKETPYRETELVVSAFNTMTGRLEQLFHENYEKGRLLRESEIAQLQSQIQPHFIFNVLELINIKCMAAGQPSICTTVQNLASLLRSNVLHDGEQMITFREELEYARYYLALQKERFEEKLQYYIDVEDPELLDYYLPKLTLQPIVENSIVHGLEPKREGGWVRISIWEEDDAIYTRISDDGVGFDPSILQRIQAPSDVSSGHTHVALKNVQRRIQLLCGDAYGIRILSDPSRGTETTVIVPIILSPENSEDPSDPIENRGVDL
ncbi:MAG: sensor histidine kinase [Lachnospiraceae bacterium]|nr:sensor histidine kinase [Lachnospiraceae bacterium]